MDFRRLFNLSLQDGSGHHGLVEHDEPNLSNSPVESRRQTTVKSCWGCLLGSTGEESDTFLTMSTAAVPEDTPVPAEASTSGAILSSTVPDDTQAGEDDALPTIDEENANISHRSHASSFDLDGYKASPLSLYKTYGLRVDHECNDRATEFNLCQISRPHMRAFHCAWFSFFLAFYVWFAVAPLLSEIQMTLNLSKQDIWTSSICSDATAILMRLIAGPLCDHVGARMPMAIFLGLASIPNFFVGFIETSAGLCLVRFFIGIAGTTFVAAMYWGTRMFTKETVGTVNGIVAGWGNAGGAFAQIIMGAVLFPAFTNYYGGDKEQSWRTICVVPAAIGLAWSFVVVFISDDAPMGYYKEMKKAGTMDNNFGATTFTRAAWTDKNTWVLSLLYAACFGVELTVNNGASLYFIEEFGQSTGSGKLLRGAAIPHDLHS